MHDEHIVSSAIENVEIEPIVSKTHISEIDSDERDDVPLTKLLKKDLFSTVEPTVDDVPATLAYSDESSSFEDIFVSTPSQPSTTNEEIGSSGHSPPVRSPIQFNSPVDVQQFVPDPDPVGDSTDNMGENIIDPVTENLNANVDDHVKPTDNCAPDDVVPNVNVPQPETKQPPNESRPKGNKSQQSRWNITTKTGRKKISPNISFIPIDGISFHLEESMQRWKYVV
ncbi:uncharacterized protein E5676_scaffold314G00330 [Cucumis melo var. makuwa]|uniref:Envelope-like protein n=1 Tax=Cucumis melo var. makuwa TaxID=1194695 RepID=A0A5A7UPR8_CUCMM|nr:uncharacterized protein E6C27_scaffold221G00310 [Cucumis melo var. makuwa]TYK08942.1 uncharacterized protein E5676_scaffold314G00330 [Cucumis melo var. makuwa]